MPDMGIFRTSVEIAPTDRPTERRRVESVIVDRGSEYTWLPTELLAEIGVAPVRVDRFESADGRILERPVGFAMVYVAGRSGVTAVAFGGPDDLALLGAHGLEGLNLRVDLVRRELVPAGPVLAAAA